MTAPTDERPDNDVGSVKIKGRLDYIDVLRAVAVLSVVSVHVWGYWLHAPIQSAHGASPRALLFRWASLGSWGVDLFIVISGFCLAHPLFKSTDRPRSPATCGSGSSTHGAPGASSPRTTWPSSSSSSSS